VPIRWLLVRDPLGELQPRAFLCADLEAAPVDILQWFVSRWQLEVIFQETRAHLGVGTQRQWSGLAIMRTTPALLRRLLNHEEIAGIAERDRFEIVTPETLSFAERVGLFSQASVIAGAHGAGFANRVFASKGTGIVELIGRRLSDSPWSMGFVEIARYLEQSVTGIVGRGDEPGSIAFDHLPYETYVIDPAEFASVART
jgi:hypothetical protein